MTLSGTGQGSLCERVFSRLADEIVLGYLLPGTHLDEQAIATRCGVSRTPVREALKQLAATGLAHYRPHRGSAVRSLSSADLDLMFEAIAELESSCARYAALRMTQPLSVMPCVPAARWAGRPRRTAIWNSMTASTVSFMC